MKRTVLFCDRHGQGEEVVADETIVFDTPDGPMEIDVCIEHAEAWHRLDAELQAWRAVARLQTPREVTPRRQRQRRDLENKALRAWAKTQGIELGERGRINEDLRARFHREVGEQARGRWSELAASKSAAPRPSPSVETEQTGDRPAVLR